MSKLEWRSAKKRREDACALPKLREIEQTRPLILREALLECDASSHRFHRRANIRLFMKKNLNRNIEIARGDITKQEVDAIVNAANATLLGGGGGDGAIHRAAGPELLMECRGLNGCRPGEAKITRGYRLPARFVIHTVGPVWRGGKHGEPETLANCYRNSLQVAAENGIKTIAFPAISCGAYGYPILEAAQMAVKTKRELLANTDKIERVIFVLWGEDIYQAYRRLL